MTFRTAKAVIVKAATVGALAGAVALASPAKAQAQQFGVAVQFGQPYYGPRVYDRDYDRDYERRFEEHRRWEEHERQEAWLRHQQWEQHEAWERHEAWEHARRDYGYPPPAYGNYGR